MNSNGKKILVVIQFSGGNDGLIPLVPYGMDAYHQQRPTMEFLQPMSSG